MIRRALSLLLGALAVAGLIAAAVWLLAFTPLLLLGALLERATRRVDPVDEQWATAPKEIDADSPLGPVIYLHRGSETP